MGEDAEMGGWGGPVQDGPAFPPGDLPGGSAEGTDFPPTQTRGRPWSRKHPPSNPSPTGSSKHPPNAMTFKSVAHGFSFFFCVFLLLL